MIAGLGPFELLIILGLALLVFGPKNLPKLGKSLGKTVKNIREGMDGDDESASASASEQPAEDVEEEKVASDGDSDAPMVFCSKCGEKNAQTDEFCHKCGAKLHVSE